MMRMPPPELTSPIVGPRSPFSSHWLNPQFPLKREAGFRDNNAQGEKYMVHLQWMKLTLSK